MLILPKLFVTVVCLLSFGVFVVVFFFFLAILLQIFI